MAMALGLVLLWLLPPLSHARSPEPAGPGPTFRFFLPLAEANPSGRLGRGLPVTSDQPQAYVLQEGDNLADLAVELGRDVSTMACVTPSANYPLKDLKPGQAITIPSASYLCHTVQPGETLASIATHFDVDVNVLVETPWNELDGVDVSLESGRRLLIFGAQRPAIEGERLIPVEPTQDSAQQGAEQIDRPDESLPAAPDPGAAPLEPPPPAADSPPLEEPWPYGDGQFIWPIEGVISQGFHNGHKAIDIAADFGLPVVAADNGVVKKAGWSEIGYGLRVVIDHQIDYLTLYGHFSEIVVEEGQVVEKGQLIGYIGSTGNSTGPHLHFELRDFGYLIDGRSLLP
jgi:murein DD-endopeptidase MepM/ murein hydrolase activator NlpD